MSSNPRDMLIFRGSRSRCSPVRLAVDQSRFLFKDSSYMNRLYLYSSLQYPLLNLIDVKCGDANPSKLVKLRQLFFRFSDSGAATTSSLPWSPRELDVPHQQKGCYGGNAWNHHPHAHTTYAPCFPVQWRLHPHTSQFDNLIIQKVTKNMHKSKLVSSSSPNFKVKIPNPK